MEKLKPKLPAREAAVAAFFRNCEGRKRLAADTPGHYSQHLKKAKHDLARAEAEFSDRCWDWTIIKAYYAIHHAGNALLSKEKGLMSKDHACLIVALEHWGLMEKRLVEKLSAASDRVSETLGLDIAFQLRKIGQYAVDEWEGLTEADAELLLKAARDIIRFVEGRL